MTSIPERLQTHVNHAAEILKSAGCRECYIFGSIAGGRATENSDIDIAVRGLPPEKFFYVYGKLSRDIDMEIDLVDIDDGSRFSKKLLRREAMVRVF